jgi:hypothetical protein
VGFVSRLFSRAPDAAVRQTLGWLVEIDAPTPAPSILKFNDAFLEDESDLDVEDGHQGPAALRTALRMVAAGDARSITLSGLPDGLELLRVGRELANEGVVVEPLIRKGGGEVDIRVRRASSSSV